MKIFVDVKDTIEPEIFMARVGHAARVVAAQAERDMRGYIPSRRVAQSSKVDGRKVQWDHPLAPVMFQGYVQVDPELGIGGFLTKDGWRSRRGIKKVRSNRQMNFAIGGPRWTYRAAEQNIRKWLKIAREAIQNGK